MRGRNIEFIIAGIKNLLKRNYKIPCDLIDVHAEVDSTLTFQENWNHIKREFHVESMMWIKAR
jgi:hypothetical protein